MAGGLGVLFGKDPLNLPLEDQISFAAQVLMLDHHFRIRDLHKPDVCCCSRDFDHDGHGFGKNDQISELKQILLQHSWGYGYWGPFLLDLDDNDPGYGDTRSDIVNLA